MSEITKKGDGPLTEERAHTLRKQMKGRRYCMDEEMHRSPIQQPSL
jgi:CHAD domain-containing protein